MSRPMPSVLYASGQVLEVGDNGAHVRLRTTALNAPPAVRGQLPIPYPIPTVERGVNGRWVESQYVISVNIRGASTSLYWLEQESDVASYVFQGEWHRGQRGYYLRRVQIWKPAPQLKSTKSQSSLNNGSGQSEARPAQGNAPGNANWV